MTQAPRLNSSQAIKDFCHVRETLEQTWRKIQINCQHDKAMHTLTQLPELLTTQETFRLENQT